MNAGTPVSEDCLTLNIWTKPQDGDRQKAVLVWIHGGSFVVGTNKENLSSICFGSCLLTHDSGSSALPSYNGQFIADEEDVVLVSIK